MPLVLTDEQLAAIAWADPSERTVDLAHRIGAPPKVVGSARRRMQAAGGWWCELRLTRYTNCDGPLLGRTKARRQQIHPGCVWERRASNRSPATEDQSRDRTAARKRDQALSRQRAHQSDRPWTREEEAPPGPAGPRRPRAGSGAGTDAAGRAHSPGSPA